MADLEPRAPSRPALDRRQFLRRSALASGGLAGAWLLGARPEAAGAASAAPAAPGGLAAPALVRAGRPVLTHGLQAGDVSGSQAVVWARADRPARLVADWSTTYTFDDPTPLRPLVVGPDTDHIGQLGLDGLPAGQRIFYRVRFEDLGDPTLASAPEIGSFATPPGPDGDISFVFTGDQAGQGWGINPDRGGMTGWETMRAQQPDLLIHHGDTIYADGPILPEVVLPDGTVWRNVTTPEKAKVAETLDEFRGNYRYNLLDDNVLRFNAEVAVLAQWDDHEVTNNWYPGEILEPPTPYTERRVDVLAERGRQAFFEYFPLRRATPGDPWRLYRKASYGPLLDVFLLDMRQYRSANGPNLETVPGPTTALLGAEQLAWLKAGLAASTATWKVVASDMPIGLIVPDGTDAAGIPRAIEAVANAQPGGPGGRELEIADLLSFLKAKGVRNVVWFTADVHYTAAHFYDPERAAFGDFDPFWEFVSGPIHAGSFGPNRLDPTFGPEVRFVKAPPEGQVNLPPSAGLQFFGLARISAATGAMTVDLMDTAGDVLHREELAPAQG